jgi:hypothetical protein
MRLSPALAGSTICLNPSWGLRPRLYAVACSAGWTTELLNDKTQLSRTR